MTFCTNCGQQNDDMSQVCGNCGTPLRSGAQGGQNPYQPSAPASYPPPPSNPYGAPQPPPSNPYGAQPPPPPYGSQPYADPYANQQQQGYGAPGYGNQPQPYGMQPGGYGGGGLMAVGEKREPLTVILLTLVTCGIYGLWWIITYGNELKAASGDQDINPVKDLLIGIVTCGIWSTIAFWYKYPKVLVDLQRRVGLPPNDFSTTTLLLGIFFAPVAIYIIQSELNKTWDAAGGVR